MRLNVRVAIQPMYNPASIEKMDYEGRVDTFWNVASEEVAFRIAEGEIIEAIGRKDGSQNLSGGFKLSYLTQVSDLDFEVEFIV